MRVILLRENLIKALSIAQRCISQRAQLPILSHILLQAIENQLQISATNLEIGTISTVNAKIEQRGEVVVPGKLLFEFISYLSSEKIELIQEGTNLKIHTGETNASFQTMNPTEFPPFPEIPNEKHMIPIQKIKDAIIRTVFAASTDETRPILTGTKIVFAQKTLSFWATDGYRLSTDRIEYEKNEEDFQAIIPATALLELTRIAQETKTEDMGFVTVKNKNQGVFLLPNIKIFTRLIEGEFPNVEKIIPVSFKTHVEVEKERFMQAVKTTSLFARGAANIVKIKIEKKGLHVMANTPQVGENEDFVEGKVEGEETESAFNYRFLLDLLGHFPDEQVVFETNGSLNPGVFKPASSKSSFLHIIMPVRVQGK